MSELKNFPFKLQEHARTFDGHPDENKDLNCVQTCIASGLQYFTGREYEPDEVKDATYGEGYVGCTSAVNDVAYCSKQGVKLHAISGSPGYLVQQAHAHLALGHVVICTIPIPYLPPRDRLNPGESHAVAFYKDSPGVLIAMNPLQTISQANTDQWWSDRLCFDQIWIMERGIMSGIPQGWRDDGKELVAPNNQKVVLGFRSWVLAHNWRPDNLPLMNEAGDGSGETEQVFSFTHLTWMASAGVQERPMGGDLLTAKSELVKALSAQKALEAQVAAQPKAADLSAQKKELKSLSDSLLDIVDSL